MPEPEKVTVLVADDHRDAVEEVAHRLAAAGMRVDQVLSAIGVITGAVGPATTGALAGLAGVASVERERTFRLPPPESGIQ